MTSDDLLIYAGIAISCGAFVTLCFLKPRLKNCVSKETVHTVEDVSQLWKSGMPPKILFNDKGLRLSRYIKVSIVIFLIGVGIAFSVAIYGISSHLKMLPAILVGAIVALTIFQSRLKKYVSKEKVRAVEDVSQLWGSGIPPKIVLNEKGLRIHGIYRLSFVFLFIGICIILYGATKGFAIYDLEERG